MTQKTHNHAAHGKVGNSIKITDLLCVRTPVFIQFGVSYLQAGVGAKWVQIKIPGRLHIKALFHGTKV